MTDTALDKRIPVNIITGFLGSGKTTLLNHWVNMPEFKDTLVLINEFGDVGLDHELVQAVDDTVVLLGSGCICCSLQGELIDALATNLSLANEGRIPLFKRVLIETTGLADPAGVISTLTSDQFIENTFRYDGTVTVLDGQYAREQLKSQYEAVKQIALADVVLISKTDLIDLDEIEALGNVCKEINDAVSIIPIVKGMVDPKVLFDIGPYKQANSENINKVVKWLNFKSPNLASSIRPAKMETNIGLAKPKVILHSNIKSFALEFKEPLDPIAMLSAISLVQSQYGDSILRIKGIINLVGQIRPVVIHGVQGSLYPTSELDSWPDENHDSKLVFIVRESVLEQIKHMFTEAINNPEQSAMAYYQNMVDQATNDE